MSYNHRVNMAIPFHLQQVANSIARSFDPDSGGDQTFTLGLTSDGTTITHYGTSTAAMESFVAMLENATPESVHTYCATDYAVRWPELTPPTLEECTAFLSGLVYSVDEGWSQFMAKNKLFERQI